MEIYSFNPQLKNDVLNTLIKNILEIEKRLEYSFSFIKTEVKLIEGFLLENFWNFEGEILEEFFTENKENSSKEKFYLENGFDLVILLEEVYYEIQKYFNSYGKLKENFLIYLKNDRGILSKKLINFHKESEILGNKIKENLEKFQ